jgi:hypothetical protein
MTLKKRFIVLIDLAAHSKQLLIFADKWARMVNAEVLVVHQKMPLIPGIGESEVIEDIKREHRKKALDELSQFVQNTLTDSTSVKLYVTTHNLEGSLSRLKQSKTLDFFFVGMKYKNLFEKMLISSTAIKLVNEMDNVIIALPEGNLPDNMDTLYIAIKQKYPLNEPALQHILSITGNSIKKIHLFSMLKPGENDSIIKNHLLSLQMRFKDQIAITYECQTTNDAFQEIKHYMQDRPGLLVVQKGSRDLVDFFRKYLVNDLINYAQIPLVILP